jgi:hypothetical protein
MIFGEWPVLIVNRLKDNILHSDGLRVDFGMDFEKLKV